VSDCYSFAAEGEKVHAVKNPSDVIQQFSDQEVSVGIPYKFAISS